MIFMLKKPFFYRRLKVGYISISLCSTLALALTIVALTQQESQKFPERLVKPYWIVEKRDSPIP